MFVFVLMLIFFNQPYSSIRKLMGNNENGINVLAYHHVVPDKEKKEVWKNNLDVMKLSTFESHMKYLYENGYQTITLDELYQWKNDEIELPEKSIVLTFDDGYTSVLKFVQPILEKYGFYASIFVIGCNTPKNTSEYEYGILNYVGLDEINKENDTLDFYSHGYALHTMDKDKNTVLENMNEDDFVYDLKNQKVVTDVCYFAYPWGKENESLFQVMEKQGVKLAFDYGNLCSVTKESLSYALPRWSMFSITTVKDIANILNK